MLQSLWMLGWEDHRREPWCVCMGVSDMRQMGGTLT